MRSGLRDAPREAVRTRTELAHALRTQGRAAEARTFMEQAWTQAQASLEEGDPVHSLARIGMGLVLAADPGAAALYEPGIAALAGRIGAGHPLTRTACERGRESGVGRGTVCP